MSEETQESEFQDLEDDRDEKDISFQTLAEEKYGEKITALEPDAYDRLEGLFYEKLDKFGNERLALTSAIGSFNFEQSSGGEQVELYTVGASRIRSFQGPTVFGYGVLVPEDGTPGRISIIIPESSIDSSLEEVKEMFNDPFKRVSANISYRPAKGVEGGYVGEIGGMSSVFDEVEDEERTFDEAQEFVNSHVSNTRIADISQGLSKTKDGSNWAAAFGVDFKRIEFATILESAVSEKGARYVLQDDSFIEASDLPPEVRGEDDELGLVAYADPDYMALDSESIVDVYGTITPNSDGQPTMDVFGYFGHYEQEATINRSSSSNGSSGSDTKVTGDAVDERTI